MRIPFLHALGLHQRSYKEIKKSCSQKQVSVSMENTAVRSQLSKMSKETQALIDLKSLKSGYNSVTML